MAFSFSSTKYSTNVTTSNWAAYGHDGADAMLIGGSGKLILSASNGVIHLSGSTDIGINPLTKNYHLRTVGSPLILSSSSGSRVYVSGSITAEEDLLVKGDTVLSGNVVVGGQLYDLNSNLILSSSVGSVIAASGSLDFPNIDKTYHIRAVNSQLILSSSTHSSVMISGSRLVFTDDAPGGGNIVNRGGHLILTSSAGSTITISGSLFASGSAHTITGSLNLFDGINEQSAGSYHLRAVDSHLILSSSAGSTVTISGNLQASGSHTFTGSLTIAATTNPSVNLSSSAGMEYFIRVIGSDNSRRLGFLNRASDHEIYISSSTNMMSVMGGSPSISVVDLGLVAKGFVIVSSSVGSVVAFSSSLDFPNTDKNYHIRAVNSQLILTSSTHSSVMISGSRLIFTDDAPGGGNIVNRGGHLILTSSGGSVITVSGSLYASGSHTFTGSVSVNDNLSLTLDSQYNVRNSVSHLIFSSTVGSVVAFSSSQDFANSDKSYHVRAVNSPLIISSSLGSVIAASASLNFTNSDKNYHVTAANSRLVLSSTIGSIVSVSGSLNLESKTAGRGARLQPLGDFTGGAGTGFAVIGQDGTRDASIALDAAIYVYDGGGGLTKFFGAPSAASFVGPNGAGFRITDAISWTAGTGGTLGGAVGGKLVIGRHDSGSLYISGSSAGLNAIVAKDGFLILSSTIGSSVRMSASLGLDKPTSTTMPAGTDNLSGSIVWVDDVKQFAIYGPLGWTRVTTGSVIG
ncbi:MAG: hypothetical protein Q8Q92_03375 [bacterium]|nr:hypothetical protein [bacterium]